MKLILFFSAFLNFPLWGDASSHSLNTIKKDVFVEKSKNKTKSSKDQNQPCRQVFKLETHDIQSITNLKNI